MLASSVPRLVDERTYRIESEQVFSGVLPMLAALSGFLRIIWEELQHYTFYAVRTASYSHL